MENILSYAQQRLSVRRHTKVPCQVVTHPEFKLIAQHVLNLSEQGMLVPCSMDVPVGQSLIVSFRVPHSNKWLDASARVVRFSRGRRRSDQGRAVGIEFVEMDAPDALRLQRNLRGLPPAIPTRKKRVDYASGVMAAFNESLAALVNTKR